MKTPLFSLFLIGAVLMSVPPMVLADATTTSSQAASTNAAPACAQGQRMERLKEALEQLGLTDAQKAQIKQIRASVTDRKQRREQIMNVLTPDQKTKFIELIKEHRNGAGTPSTSSES